MTKEKLKKEAGNWLRKYLLCCNCEKKCNCIDSNSYCEEQVLKAYIDSAEPREKQIEIDARQIRALQKQSGELTDRVKELEAQIEKMQEKLKADLIARLEEQMQYSTSPSCTKGMELFIKSIEEWEIKENENLY